MPIDPEIIFKVYSHWVSCGVFLLMFFGFILRVLWGTYKADLKDTAREIDPWYLYMVGASKYKTIFNIMALFAVAFFVPPHYIDIALAQVLPFNHAGMGHSIWVLVGFLSDSIISKYMKKVS